MTTSADRWKIAREKANLSQGALAKKAGCKQQVVSKLESGFLAWSSHAPQLAAALGVSEAWIRYGDGAARYDAPPNVTKQFREPSAAQAQTAPAPVKPKSVFSPPDDIDLPVYGVAEALSNPDSLVISPEPVEYISRPSPLVGVPGAYGVYVAGESMIPAFRHGWIALVHPGRSPARDDDVVVILRDGNDDRYALLKTYVRNTAEGLVLAQHNPKRELPPIPRDRVISVHLVVGSQMGG